MAEKTDSSSHTTVSGIGTDYALMAMASGVALLALLYLILI